MSKPTNKDFNLSITPLWYSQNGNMRSVIVNKEMYDALQKIQEGGKLYIKFLQNKKDEKSPDAYLEYMDQDKLNKLREKYSAKDTDTSL